MSLPGRKTVGQAPQGRGIAADELGQDPLGMALPRRVIRRVANGLQVGLEPGPGLVGHLVQDIAHFVGPAADALGFLPDSLGGLGESGAPSVVPVRAIPKPRRTRSLRCSSQSLWLSLLPRRRWIKALPPSARMAQWPGGLP